jgi:glucose-6-phosphate 1-dehydrogenase
MSHRPAAETVQIEPNLVILFGATGDLARRSLLPALYRLLRRREFSDKLHVLGVATKPLDDDGFRRLARDAVVDAGLDRTEVEEWCGRNLSYQPVGEGYEALARRVQEVERRHDLPGNRAFYLAVPPQVFEETVEGIAGAGLHRSGGWVRIVVEKPFGTDLESARRLNRLLHRHFDESQIYRIDHFLAKETVQNLLVFRFANPLFESAWNRDRVQAVQITVAEDIGIGDRAGYFDEAGTLRDMVQNHLAQLLTLVAMEPPVRFEPDDIRNEKVKVLRAIRPLEPGDVVRGRYGPGTVDGEAVAGYLEEPGVPSDSTTETYAAVRFEIDNWRWRGVPFLARTGKRMARRLTQIVVVFREPPVGLFSAHGGQVRGNELYITLQPDEGFDLLFDVKTPGEGVETITRSLSFRYADAFGPLPDAYETLLADILAGDQTLFVRADETEEAWRILDPVLDRKEAPEPYPAGTWGPASAERLARAAGVPWRVLDPDQKSQMCLSGDQPRSAR